MKAHYLVQIDNPEQNIVKVTLKLTRPKNINKMTIFLPSWSPGSDLMREYGRNVRWIQFSQENGEVLSHTQTAKGQWVVNWDQSELKKEMDNFECTYQIYLNELTVRTSQVNAAHAFLHGPSYLMGVKGEALENPTIEFRFPTLWSKLSTSLNDVPGNRGKFIYKAENYDILIDCPVEIGCHETDGFMYGDRPHNLAFYGNIYPHHGNLKNDIKQIVKTVAEHFKGDLPYDQYLFITHFGPKLRGGLEHLNSTALQFDGRKLANRKDYIAYLSLVAHEYFHLWNVKRIRPQELGPFDYLNEGYTSMLWLSEGLTSFVDDLFVYRAGLSTIEEYLDQVKQNLDVYYSTPGKKFHSLEQSSFNAWVKLYRPDENTKNSSISYYLKGGLVFNVLHALLVQKGRSLDDLLILLWQGYLERPDKGITKAEVYEMVKSIGGEDVLNTFISMIETTNDIDFDSCFKTLGCEIKWIEYKNPYLGVEWEYTSERVFARVVLLDTPAYKAGINPGDEIIFLNGLRFLREDAENLASILEVNKSYEMIISRAGKLERIEILCGITPRIIKEISVVDKDLAAKSFAYKSTLSLAQKA
jgi:predicted metalloprotease with PDZ domain